MGRVVWVATAVLMVGAIVWGWMVLPTTGVPMHSDFDGTITRYGTSTEFVWTNVGLSLLMLVVMPLFCMACLKGDAPFLNIPNKDHWLAPERAEATRTDIADQLWSFLAATNLLLVAGTIDTVLVATTGRSPVPFLIVFLAFIAYTVWWTVRLTRRYRLPDQ